MSKNNTFWGKRLTDKIEQNWVKLSKLWHIWYRRGTNGHTHNLALYIRKVVNMVLSFTWEICRPWGLFCPPDLCLQKIWPRSQKWEMFHQKTDPAKTSDLKKRKMSSNNSLIPVEKSKSIFSLRSLTFRHKMWDDARIALEHMLPTNESGLPC